MIALRIKVSGKVQGVFFRASTKGRAEELGICGWVKNESDGSVLIEAEGEEGSMNEFLNWCKAGPLMSKVENVSTETIEAGNYTDFKIRY